MTDPLEDASALLLGSLLSIRDSIEVPVILARYKVPCKYLVQELGHDHSFANERYLTSGKR